MIGEERGERREGRGERREERGERREERGERREKRREKREKRVPLKRKPKQRKPKQIIHCAGEDPNNYFHGRRFERQAVQPQYHEFKGCQGLQKTLKNIHPLALCSWRYLPSELSACTQLWQTSIDSFKRARNSLN